VFGGHLAASGGSRSWGAGLGAANINGGPYHIRVTKIDATAIGNRDNQITSGAILPPQTTVVTELHQTTAAGADLVPANKGLEISATLPAAGGTINVVDYATVSPSGATGSVDFRYYTSLTDCNADTTGTSGTGAGNDKALDAQGTATSDITSFTSAGTFWWRAFFTGTGISVPSFSLCNEKLTITQDTSTSTLLHETDSTGTDVSPARELHRRHQRNVGRDGNVQWRHGVLESRSIHHRGHVLLAGVLLGHRLEQQLEQSVRRDPDRPEGVTDARHGAESHPAGQRHPRRHPCRRDGGDADLRAVRGRRHDLRWQHGVLEDRARERQRRVHHDELGRFAQRFPAHEWEPIRHLPVEGRLQR
jgi:hypothetical protein